MTDAGSAHRTVTRVRRDRRYDDPDRVVVEAPLEIRLAGTPLAVVMRTPGHDADLIRGFAITEGIVIRPEEFATAEPVAGDEGGDRWQLVLRDGVTVDPERFRRNLYATSSCGVCGKASIDAVRVAAPPLPSGPFISAEQLLRLPELMRAEQATFDSTGGLHAAAVFAADGSLVVLREDIGRHNAVDKVVGALAAAGRLGEELTLLVSGRVSFEVIQKAAVATIPIVAGVSAASSLAIDLADELGVTLVGFLREDGFNVYAGRNRIVG